MPDLSRRRALLSGAVLALAPPALSGCTRHEMHNSAPRASLLDETLALEDSLLATYDVAIATLGPRAPLTRTLVHIRDEHAAHRAALLSSGAKPATQPTGTSTPTATPTTPPAGRTRAMLIAAETAAARIRTSTCLHAPRDLSPLLGSLAASETTHAALLRGVR